MDIKAQSAGQAHALNSAASVSSSSAGNGVLHSGQGMRDACRYIKRGMKYEVFKFMDRHDNLENIQRWREVLEEEELAMIRRRQEEFV